MISPILKARLSDYLGKIPLQELMVGFPEEMLAKAQRYRQEADAYRFVLGRHLLRKEMERIGSHQDVLNQITYTDLGKPLLPNVWFSITHSGNWVLCVISSSGPIGLDVEEVRPMKQPEHLRNWFTGGEWDRIRGATDSMRELYYLWTKKEALLKATGYGLSGLDRVRFIGDEQVYLEGEEKVWTAKELDFTKEEGVVGHVCY